MIGVNLHSWASVQKVFNFKKLTYLYFNLYFLHKNIKTQLNRVCHFEPIFYMCNRVSVETKNTRFFIWISRHVGNCHWEPNISFLIFTLKLKFHYFCHCAASLDADVSWMLTWWWLLRNWAAPWNPCCLGYVLGARTRTH